MAMYYPTLEDFDANTRDPNSTVSRIVSSGAVNPAHAEAIRQSQGSLYYPTLEDFDANMSGQQNNSQQQTAPTQNQQEQSQAPQSPSSFNIQNLLADISKGASYLYPGIPQIPSNSSSFPSTLQDAARNVAPLNIGAARFGGNLLQDIGSAGTDARQKMQAAGMPVSPFNGGQTLQNIGRNVVNTAPQTFGLPNPTTGQSFAEGLAQGAPYALTPAGESAALSKIPYLGKLLSPTAQVGAQQGAAYGATQSAPGQAVKGTLENAAAGGALGAVLPPAINTLISGGKNISNSLKNAILDHTENASQTGGALTPEETAANLKNYVGANNQQLPVDFGTAANSPSLQKTYSALQSVPFSGASQNANLVKSGLIDKRISDIQGQIDQLGNSTAPVTDAQQGVLSKTLTDATSQKNSIDQQINSAPQILDSLAQNVPDRSAINQSIKGDLTSVYNSNKKTSAQNYAPINDAKNLDLTENAGADTLANYKAAAIPIMNKRLAFDTMFGNDNDLSTSLKGELDKSISTINATSQAQQYPFTLGEARTRLQNLGQLAAAATAGGNRYEGMLLGNLRSGLAKDVDTSLRGSGNDQLADQLATANQYHAQNIVPFWANNTIRKSVMDKNYIPPKGTLATALHDPNNHGILASLPQNTQNNSLYQLVTGGKGTSSGMSNLSPQAIGAKYSGLPVEAKAMVNHYNPQADSLFESIPSLSNRSSSLSDLTKSLQKQIDRNKSLNDKFSGALQKSSQSLSSKLSDAKQSKYGAPLSGGMNMSSIIGGGLFGGAALMKPAVLATLPAGIGTARYLSKALTDPEMINAYINRTRFPEEGHQAGRAASRIAPTITTALNSRQEKKQ